MIASRQVFVRKEIQKIITIQMEINSLSTVLIMDRRIMFVIHKTHSIVATMDIII